MLRRLVPSLKAFAWFSQMRLFIASVVVRLCSAALCRMRAKEEGCIFKVYVGNVCQWVHSETVMTDGVRACLNVCVRECVILAMSAYTFTITSSPVWHPGRSAGNCTGCLNVGICACAWKMGIFSRPNRRKCGIEREPLPVVLALCQAKHVQCVFVVWVHIWERVHVCVYTTTAACVRPTAGKTSCQGFSVDTACRVLLLCISRYMCICVCKCTCVCAHDSRIYWSSAHPAITS